MINLHLVGVYITACFFLIPLTMSCATMFGSAKLKLRPSPSVMGVAVGPGFTMDIFREVPDNRLYYDMKKPNCPSCHTDVNGTNVCNFNGKLETIPKSLYNVGPHGKTSLKKILSSEINTVNDDKYIAYNYEGDKPMNGSNFYGDVQGVMYGNNKSIRSSNYETNDILECF